MSITIDNKYLNQIKKILAFPGVDELLLNDTQIKDLIISPVFEQYFTKFPKKAEEVRQINGEVSIPFPDEQTFGVLDCRVTDVGMIGGTGGTFWDVVAFQVSSGSISVNGTGAYGIKNYNPSGLMYQKDMQRQKFKSQQNMYTTIKSRVDVDNRQLICYSSASGQLNITWAKYSENFSDVRFERRNDVVKLCQAELLLHLSDSASILADSGLEVTINTDALKSRAEEIRTEVWERWNEEKDIILHHAV